MKKTLRRLLAAACALVLCLTPVSALTVEEALALLEENYVGEIPAAAYEAKTLDELVAIIGDPYTFYMSPTGYEEFIASVEDESSVTGIGTGVEYTADGFRIISVIPGGGAEEAGLKLGDYIIAVDGVSCAPADESLRALIIGEAGTYVTITVRHEDGSTQDYRIERRTLTLRNTTVSCSDGVGVIDCDSFGSQTTAYFYDGITEYDEDVRIWIVDLRSNTGGYADAAVSSLGLFTGFGPRLYYRDRSKSTTPFYYYFYSSTDKPAIVLVNGFSASGSELFAGGIRAAKAGIVVGSRTYGKGTAQLTFDSSNTEGLFDGDSLKITSYRFYCSDCNTTDRIGVIPTLYVSDLNCTAIASLLTTEKPKSGDCLRLTLNGGEYYIELAKAQKEENAAALGELLSALAPDVKAVLFTDDGSELFAPADLLARYGGGASSRWFTDVADSPYALELNTLATYGLVQGDGSGRFDPQSPLTRAQLCSLLAQTLNVTSTLSDAFVDVPEGEWYTGDVNAMSRLGFVNGIGNGCFDPNGSLTQEQLIAVMGRLARFLNFSADDYALALSEEDLAADALAPFADWSRDGLKVLTEYDGNMLYASADQIDPHAPVTREQAAATVCKMLKTLGILAY